MLFLIKNKTIFQNTVSFIQGKPENGLTYNSNATIEDLVNKDTDQDGVLDWEEGLWGTDPTKKETTPGISDKVAIEKIKAERLAAEVVAGSGPEGGGLNGTDNIGTGTTQTDKFSQELFATVSTLNQNGTMDQATVDKLSSSLAERIQNSTPRKTYLLSDINVIKDDSLQAVKKYNNNPMSVVYKGYKGTENVIGILEEFIADENNPNIDALLELDPIIEQINKIIIDMTKTNVPQKLAQVHLDVLNGLERVMENLNDIKLYDSDVIVALSAVSQYDNSNTTLESAIFELKKVIWEELFAP